MQIVPMRDLKNTVEIERRCAESNEPVFVTKNGYGRLVVMDIDYYERTMRKIDEASLVNRGISDYVNGRTVDGRKSLKKLREKHGL
ncbi:type II toxin-antitoxin system Phd/YefM family antitoxin [Butyrivibrio sp. WCD3002]|uniref:type II toxin-antitoxin system Phd/YefM family antitoxin n=1 Tax=Butyrivibrio sp. WCD3002 TaxID=1280676 RepID=UPI000417678C|nr:type II toxin-antitoxin system Phd/YefM family antitoxin [Butyrivibrio sp. WCD3002]